MDINNFTVSTDEPIMQMAGFEMITILILSIIIGFYVVSRVTPALHTPLMAITNAISSIVIVGAIIGLGAFDGNIVSQLFSAFAIMLCSVNIFGGFFVTKRMLEMYKTKKVDKNK